MKYLEIENHHFFYRISKRSGNKHPAVICIHGSGADSVVWSYQISRLSRHFNIIAPDLPGHGRSDGKPLQTAMAYAHWLKKFAVALSIESFYLMGHSFGGAVIQAFAHHYPENSRGLILAGTGTHFKFSRIYAELKKQGLDISNKTVLKECAAAENVPDRFMSNYETLKNMCGKTLHDDLLAAGKFDSRPWISDINIPALVLWGEYDQITPKQLPLELSERLPYAQFKIIPDAGHVIMIDARDEYNNAVKRFINHRDKANV